MKGWANKVRKKYFIINEVHTFTNTVNFRAMVLEAMELSSFMSRVTSSNPADKQLQVTYAAQYARIISNVKFKILG